jgi:hypothetical protein
VKQCRLFSLSDQRAADEPSTIAAMSFIRVCGPEDMPAVARLFQKTFVDRRSPPPESLSSYLGELFLHHPWYDPELASRVYVSPEGVVRGFIGVLPLRMCFRGRPIRAAVAGSLMVDRPEQHPLAGARLLRSFAGGPQELSISENANRVSESMWQKLGARTVAFESLEWLRVLRPAGVALAFAREWFAPAAVLRPLASIVDRVAQRTSGNPLAFQARPGSYEHDIDASDELLAEQIPRLAASYPVHPEWDQTSLPWVLAHARTKGRRGPICRRMVYGKNNVPIGCYVYYGRPHGVAWVLQILAQPECTEAVLDSLLTHAFRNGSVAVRGRTHPRLMNPLMRRGSMFFHRSSTVVHSADDELLRAVHSGDALVTGLAGEGWTRLIGDSFA